MRKWAFYAVSSCPRQSEITGDRIFTIGSVEGPEGLDDADNPDRPFIVIRFSTTQPALGNVKQQRIQVWIHWDSTTAIPTDELASELEDWLPSQAPAWYPAAPDGDYVMDCVWEDTSGDGFDDHFQTNTRYVTFLITYKPSSS